MAITIILIAAGLYMHVALWLLLMRKWTPRDSLAWPAAAALCTVVLAIALYGAFDEAMKRRGL